MELKEKVIEMFKGDFLEENVIMDGFQVLLKFENGYGVSFVNHYGSYGNEIAVIFFEGDKWDLTYSTDITNDVIGHLEDDEVINEIRKVKRLDKDGKLH